VGNIAKVESPFNSCPIALACPGLNWLKPKSFANNLLSFSVLYAVCVNGKGGLMVLFGYYLSQLSLSAKPLSNLSATIAVKQNNKLS
jgi:hypothetical protein